MFRFCQLLYHLIWLEIREELHIFKHYVYIYYIVGLEDIFKKIEFPGCPYHCTFKKTFWISYVFTIYLIIARFLFIDTKLY